MLRLALILAFVALASPAHANPLPKLDYVALDGTTYKAADLAGKVVVVHFWAAWAKPAVKMIPALAANHARYKDRCVVVLAVVMTNDPVDVKALGITYPVVRTTKAIEAAFGGPANLPTTIVFDHGAQASQHVGMMTESALDAAIQAAHPCP